MWCWSWVGVVLAGKGGARTGGGGGHDAWGCGLCDVRNGWCENCHGLCNRVWLNGPCQASVWILTVALAPCDMS